MTGVELRERRKALHLTLAQLAELMHTTAATLSRWENGNRQMPPMAVALFERIEREERSAP
jgi:transcriptional regulator with XRE-family HTH domain